MINVVNSIHALLSPWPIIDICFYGLLINLFSYSILHGGDDDEIFIFNFQIRLTPPKYIQYEGFMKLNTSLGQTFPCILVAITISDNLTTHKISHCVNTMYMGYTPVLCDTESVQY